ncbi:hypothetical protein [Streptomyces ardesiacus]|uniref:hypothetical protein n=1 Tax=Streptomyces ardesiacus TaxID=285564 RepID=UPI00364B0E2E
MLHQGLLLGSVIQRAARRASFPVVVVHVGARLRTDAATRTPAGVRQTWRWARTRIAPPEGHLVLTP